MTILRRINPNKMVNIDYRRNCHTLHRGGSRKQSTLVRLIKRIPFGEKSIFNLLETLFDVKFNDVRSDSSTYDAYSTVTFEVSDGIPLSKKRRSWWKLGSQIVDTRRSSVFRDCLERVHCEILLLIILHPSSPQ